jgi:uncharacterized protein
MAKLQDNEKTMGMLAHLLSIFTGFIGPLVIFLVEKKSKFVKDNAKNALNFQISMIIYVIVSVFLFLLLIGMLLLPALIVFALVVEIMGTVKAANGEVFKYPLAIEFIK